MAVEGQFKIRRNAETGKIEKIPEAEQIELRKEAARTTPMASQDDRDAAFLAEHAPDDVEIIEDQPEAGPVDAIAAEAGAAAGAPFGPGAAAVGGAAASFLTSKLLQPKPRPIGSLESGGVTGTTEQSLEQLVALAQEAQRVGQPIKGAITTDAFDSRL